MRSSGRLSAPNKSRDLGTSAAFRLGWCARGPVDQIICRLFGGSLPGQAPVGTPFETADELTTTPPNSPPAAQVLLVCLFKRYGARQRRRPRARSRHLSIAPMVHADRGRRAVEVRRLFFVYGGGGCVTFTTGDFRHPPKSQDLPRARAIEFRACA